jgi:hypothetical protein
LRKNIIAQSVMAITAFSSRPRIVHPNMNVGRGGSPRPNQMKGEHYE